MSMLLTAVAAVLFIAIGGSLFRVVRGPTLWTGSPGWR